MTRIRTLIMGAAGRDFHNFNVVYREDPRYEVTGFTAAQIPNIAGRRYPAALAGRAVSGRAPDLPGRRSARADRAALGPAGGLRVQRRLLHARHAPERHRERGRRRLRPARARCDDAESAETGGRRVRRPHRRGQEPDDAPRGATAARGRACGSRWCATRCRTAISWRSACSGSPRLPTSRATSARSRRSRSTSPTS